MVKFCQLIYAISFITAATDKLIYHHYLYLKKNTIFIYMLIAVIDKNR